MNRWTFSFLVAFCLIAVDPSSAAVFERDWKTPGDGLLTYDDVSQRLWLDLSVSLLDQFSGATLEDRYQDAIEEILPGELFEGFTVANHTDVRALGASAGIDTMVYNFAVNGAQTTDLIDLLGRTITFADGRFRSMGFVDEFSVTRPADQIISVFDVVPPRSNSSGNAGLLAGDSSLDSAAPSTVGVYLFRQVPEPSSLVSGIHLLMRPIHGCPHTFMIAWIHFCHAIPYELRCPSRPLKNGRGTRA